MSGPAAVRACFGTTAVSYRDTAHAYAEALGQATSAIVALDVGEQFPYRGCGGAVALGDAGPEALQDCPAGRKEV